MPSWKLKAAIQGTISFLPGSRWMNHFLQKHVSRSLGFDESHLQSKWVQVEEHLKNYQTAVQSASTEFVALELGTGWFPVVPIGLWLKGASRVYTFDLDSLLSHERVVKVLKIYHQWIESGKLRTHSLEKTQRLQDVLKKAESMEAREILKSLDVYSIVGDCSRSGLPNESIDLFVSNNVFEHIPKVVLKNILIEFKRLAKTQGVMSHYVDMGDHYASFDKSINVYNYMQYSEGQWALANNPLQYQNRLRNSDYLQLHQESGWKVVRQDPTSGQREELQRIKLQPQFQKYTEEDLLIYGNWIISKPN